MNFDRITSTAADLCVWLFVGFFFGYALHACVIEVNGIDGHPRLECDGGTDCE